MAKLQAELDAIQLEREKLAAREKSLAVALAVLTENFPAKTSSDNEVQARNERPDATGQATQLEENRDEELREELRNDHPNTGAVNTDAQTIREEKKLPLLEVSIRLLEREAKLLKTAEINDYLFYKLGRHKRKKALYQTLWSALKTESEKPDARIFKEGPKWGLSTWKNATSSSPTALVQLPWPPHSVARGSS